jgi:hypothetical protein
MTTEIFCCGQTPCGLLGLADLDTRHKHESESEWCQAHHVRNLLRPTLTIIHAKPLMLLSLMASNHNNSKNHYNNCSGYKVAREEFLTH